MDKLENVEAKEKQYMGKQEMEQAIDFYKNKLEQLTDENDLLDKKMSKLSDEKIRLERGIIKFIEMLGE